MQNEAMQVLQDSYRDRIWRFDGFSFRTKGYIVTLGGVHIGAEFIESDSIVGYDELWGFLVEKWWEERQICSAHAIEVSGGVMFMVLRDEEQPLTFKVEDPATIPWVWGFTPADPWIAMNETGDVCRITSDLIITINNVIGRLPASVTTMLQQYPPRGNEMSIPAVYAQVDLAASYCQITAYRGRRHNTLTLTSDECDAVVTALRQGSTATVDRVGRVALMVTSDDDGSSINLMSISTHVKDDDIYALTQALGGF